MAQITDVTNSLPRHQTKRYKRRNPKGINTIVVHHSATSSGSPQAFAKYHVESNGWPGIGYHYVIGKDGAVHLTNHETAISYHAAGVNTNSIGICLVGHFDQEKPTQAQISALVELCRDIKGRLGITRIIGHREVPAPKSCPGKNLDMDALRAEV